MDSPREAKKEDEPAIDERYCRKVETEKTYNRLCAKKRIMYAKEVLAEKKANELTAKFEADKDAYFARKQAAAQARAKTLYERQVQARITADQEARINARMRAEERHQVMAMISDSRSRKVGTAAQSDEEHMARDYLRAARMAFDAEKRAKRLEQEEQRRELCLEKIAAQEQRMVELRQERIQEQGDKAVEDRKKRQLQYQRIEERRKVLEAEREQARQAKEAQFDSVLRAAAERREFTQRAKVESLSARSTSCHERAEANLRDLESQRSLSAREAPRDRRHEHERLKNEQRRQKRLIEEAKARERHQYRMEQVAKQEEQHKEMQAKIHEKHAKVRPTAYVLVQESGDPQLAYLRVKRDMEQRRDQAKITKQYDEHFPDAEELLTERGLADVRMTRLTALEQGVMKGQPVGGSTNFNELGSEQQKKVYGQRTLRCGLCEQDYTADMLKGKTTVSRIEKLRRGWLGAGHSEKHHHAGSYDQVRLCTMCLQFVRQHAKDTK